MLTYHPDALQTLYASLIETAGGQAHIPLQTPGTVSYKSVNGINYTYWRVYKASGQRADEILGVTDAAETLVKLEQKRSDSTQARAIAESIKTLRIARFAVADNSSALTIASIFNAGLFRQGAVLVGSHAFGALLNGLGIRLAANYQTNDIDIGSRAQVSLAIPDDRSLLDVIKDTGLPFLEVPGLDPRQPATSYKQRGSMLKVDLLVPGSENYETKALPGLKAYATGLPYFDYLIDESEHGYVTGKDHIVPVRVPAPARFALHKLIVSTLRSAAFGVKSNKDMQQAVVMLSATLNRNQDWVEEAIDALPPEAYQRVAQAADHALNYAEGHLDITVDTLERLASLG
ncbi:GSU2403 family nucleotidyltransferase fold protein [Burkholderia guangdongensis]|uniref:GSU2403 family nucleotidyltransferase fold protein n=1 Tax=Burkholderia guangdongensis TaxID=1792500 RepID=UPI0015C75A17|nr:GSU2403 family nucleotidyltransferase fold protein [Burkholderia guangdongensis]